jgi:hypothetical protein
MPQKEEISMLDHPNPPAHRSVSARFRPTKILFIAGLVILSLSAALAIPVVDIVNLTISLGSNGQLDTTLTSQSETCTDPVKNLFQLRTYNNFVYVDPSGGQHSLAGSAYYIISPPPTAACATAGSYPVTLHGSNYTITVTPNANGVSAVFQAN